MYSPFSVAWNAIFAPTGLMHAVGKVRTISFQKCKFYDIWIVFLEGESHAIRGISMRHSIQTFAIKRKRRKVFFCGSKNLIQSDIPSRSSWCLCSPSQFPSDMRCLDLPIISANTWLRKEKCLQYQLFWMMSNICRIALESELIGAPSGEENTAVV